MSDLGLAGLDRGELGHVDPALVVGAHQIHEQPVGIGAARRAEPFELLVGRHARHLGRRHAHPRHVLVRLPGLGAPRCRSNWTIRPMSTPWPTRMPRATVRSPGAVSGRVRKIRLIWIAWS